MKVRDQFLLGLAVGATAAAAHAPVASARAAAAASHAPAAVAYVPQGRNSIHGQVFGEGGRPVTDVYVELLDDYYSTITQIRTSAGGRFTFAGISPGRYKVRVRPYGTDYTEQTQDVEIINYSVLGGSSGADNRQVDFYLKLRPEVTAGPFAAPGSVFAEEVPEVARKLFERGLAELRAKNEKAAFESLKGAIEAHPTYYAALDRLGSEYVLRGHYQAAFVLLTEALRRNPRSFSSSFGLGVALYNLKQYDQALEHLARATTLYNKSVNAHLWHGMTLHRAGKLDQAEAALRRARDLSGGKTPEVHFQIARVYGDQKRYTEAADSLEQFLKTQPDSRDSKKIRETIRQLREKAAAAASR